MSWKFVVSLVVALIVAVFALLNSEPVTINLLFKKAVISQALVILISVIVGALVVALLGSISRFKLSAALKDEKQKVEELEKELEKFSQQTTANTAEHTVVPDYMTPAEPVTMPEQTYNYETDNEKVL